MSENTKKRHAKLSPEVLVVGSITIDTIVENRRTAERLGGVVTYGGITFQRLGVGAAAVTNVAEADRAVLGILTDEGVAVHAGKSPRTTRFVNETRGDFREQLMPEAAGPVAAVQVRPFLEQIRHIHAGPLHPDDIEPQALALMGESKKLVSLDAQGYLRRAEGGRIVPGISGGLEGALRVAHIIKADEGELTLMLDHFRESLPGFLQRFRIDEAVVTRGSRGASVWTRAGEGYHFAAETVRRPVSTVGAGDVFFAAYLVAHVYRKLDIDLAAGFAGGIAARQVAGKHIAPASLNLPSEPAGAGGRKRSASPSSKRR